MRTEHVQASLLFQLPVLLSSVSTKLHKDTSAICRAPLKQKKNNGVLNQHRRWRRLEAEGAPRQRCLLSSIFQGSAATFQQIRSPFAFCNTIRFVWLSPRVTSSGEMQASVVKCPQHVLSLALGYAQVQAGQNDKVNVERVKILEV